MYSTSQSFEEFFRSQAGEVDINNYYTSHPYFIIACGLSFNLTQGLSVFSGNSNFLIFPISKYSRLLPASRMTKRASNLLFLDYYMIFSLNNECHLPVLTELTRISPTNTDFQDTNINSETAAIRILNI